MQDFSEDVPIGEKIRQTRIPLGLNQNQGAIRAGLSSTNLKEVETGVKNITLETLHKLSIGWGIDPSTLDKRLASNTSSPLDVDPNLLLFELSQRCIAVQREVLDRWFPKTLTST